MFEIEVLIRPQGQSVEVDFSELSVHEQNAAIMLLEHQREQLRTASCNPEEGLIRKQRFERLALDVYHSKQLLYSTHSKNLKDNATA